MFGSELASLPLSFPQPDALAAEAYPHGAGGHPCRRIPHYELILIVRAPAPLIFCWESSRCSSSLIFSLWLRLDLLRAILSRAMPYMAIAVIVLFQSEIRRTLARIGRKRLFRKGVPPARVD